MTDTREVDGSPVYQGQDEEIAYGILTTEWGSNPTSVSVKLYDTDGTDVSSTSLSGSASVSGDTITTPVVKLLTAGEKYRLEVKFTCSGNVFEPFLIIWGAV
jgi:hypothetical protein